MPLPSPHHQHQRDRCQRDRCQRHRCQRHWRLRRAWAALLLSAAVTTAGTAGFAAAQGQPATQNQAHTPAQAAPRQQQLIRPSPTLVERLRRLLNLNPPLAVGGSRSGSAQQLCLLSPWLGPQPQRSNNRDVPPPLVVVPTDAPTLLSSAPLNELQLLRNGRIIWQQRASSTAAISGAIPWPLQPLQPEEQLMLRLRPRGAPGGDFAVVRLQAAAAPVLLRYQQLRSQLQATPSRWPAVIEAELERNPALAVALLTDPAAPAAIRSVIGSAAGCALESTRKG